MIVVIGGIVSLDRMRPKTSVFSSPSAPFFCVEALVGVTIIDWSGRFSGRRHLPQRLRRRIAFTKQLFIVASVERFHPRDL